MRLKPQTYALTAVAYQRRRVFQQTSIAELFIATLFRYRDSGKFQLHAFVVMPDHAHLLLTPTDKTDYTSATDTVTLGIGGGTTVTGGPTGLLVAGSLSLITGNTLASTTRSPCRPLTRSCGSSTALSPEPIAHVPTGW